MSALAQIVQSGRPALQAHYGDRLRRKHHQALRAIVGCRDRLGEMHLDCPDCEHHDVMATSCGHRSCPQCQNHTTTQWLDRQRNKLLPVDYFLVTFTLPAQLRPVAQSRPKVVFSALFQAAASTLKSFGLNHRLHVQLGQLAVLHTHSRKLDFHPHVHVVVPGGGIDIQRRQWKSFKGRYLFNGQNLARVFRARLLAALEDAGIVRPPNIPKQWIVDCRCVGRGAPALEYLSRYLYRGVIQDHQIVRFDAQQVSFRYTHAQSGIVQILTLPIADFLWRVLQHVLPPGFHRVREYGFVHPRAKATLRLVQWVLKAHITSLKPKPRLMCHQCQTPLRITVRRYPYPAPT